jgi:acetyl esterase/lipase
VLTDHTKSETMSARPFTMRLIILIALTAVAALAVRAQDLIPLWPEGGMPNSKGLPLKDSIFNERIYRVGVPKLRAFLPSSQENKKSAVIICPGGGYERLAYVISGLQLAKWFNTMGVSAFVLDYRLPNSPDLKQREIGPLQDAQRAMRIVRAHAARWGIDPGKIGVLGTSAGGHLASMLGTRTDDVSAIGDSLDKVSFAPDFMILVSPVISMGVYAHVGSRNNLLGANASKELVDKYSNELKVTSTTPPSFIVHAFNDKSVSVRNSLMFYQALVEKNVSSSLHVFPQGGHSIALRNNPGSAELWTTLCEAWMDEMGFLVPFSGKR